MKLLKNLALGLAAASLMGGSASAVSVAPTVLHVVGSTAFRASATAAIIGYLSNNTTGGVVNAAYVGSGTSTASGLFGASVGIFENSDASIIVKTTWTGSLAGLTDVTTDQPGQGATAYKFLANNTTVSAVVLTGGSPTYGATVAASNETDASAPEAAFSDSFDTSIESVLQTDTKTFLGTVGTGSNTATTGTGLATLMANSQLTDAGVTAGSSETVGIIPFGWWIGNSTSASGITNITQQAAEYLVDGGFVPVNFLTGLSSDQFNTAFLIGRNEDSGTRICAEAEVQNPNGAFGQATSQWELTFVANGTSGSTVTTGSGLNTGGATANVTGLNPFPASAPLFTEPNIDFGVFGHSGYVSGGDVADVLLASNPTTGLTFGVNSKNKTTKPPEYTGKAFFIGYLGFSDGNKVASLSVTTQTTNNRYLTYNGVAPTVANIQNGSYSFWAYEHLYYSLDTAGHPNAVVSGGNQAVADGIADLVFSTYAPTNSNGVTAATDAAENTLSPPVSGILLDSAVLASKGQEGGIESPTY